MHLDIVLYCIAIMKRSGKKVKSKRGRNNRSLARNSLPGPSVRSLQSIKFWIGFLVDTAIPGPSGGFAQLMNATLIPDFSVRLAGWLNYRILAMTADLSIIYPRGNDAAGFPAAVAISEYEGFSGAVLSPPSSMSELSVLPQCKYVSTSPDNPRNTVRLGWRNRDINSLLFQPVSSLAIAGKQVYIVGRIENGSAGIANKLVIRGRFLIEARDMVAFSSLARTATSEYAMV